jgi:hypothetical protein
MGTTQWKKFAVERIPIPRFEDIDQSLLARLVDLVSRRISTDSEFPMADVGQLEDDIEACVVKAYGLTDQDSSIIDSYGLTAQVINTQEVEGN